MLGLVAGRVGPGAPAGGACGGGGGGGRGETLEKAKPLEAYLEEKLDVDVEIYIPLSQSGVIEAIRFGQADVAFMGAWPAQLAGELGGGELALAGGRAGVHQQKTGGAPS